MDDDSPKWNEERGTVEGWLEKRGDKGIVKAYRRRYFRTHGNRLNYSETPDSPALGFIDFTSILGFETADCAGSQKKGLFNVITAGRTYALAAVNDAIMNEWLVILGKIKERIREQTTSRFVSGTNESTVMHSQQSPQALEGTPSASVANAAKLTRGDLATPTVALGSPSTKRKMPKDGDGTPSIARRSHRRNSSLDSPLSGEKDPNVVAEIVPSPVTPISSVPDFRRQSMGGGTAKRIGSGSLSAQKLVTPPPFQLKKMMDSAKHSPSPILGVKSHSSVALIPGLTSTSSSNSSGSTPLAQQASVPDPREELRHSAPEFIYTTPDVGMAGPLEEAKIARILETKVQAAGVLESLIQAPDSSSPVSSASTSSAQQQKDEAVRPLHPMGIPTQGVVRLPKNKVNTPKKEEEGEVVSEYGIAVKRAHRQPGLSLSDIEQRLLAPRAPVEELTSISNVGVPVTSSFEGLAERVETLMARSATAAQPSAPTFNSAKSHASRFQEDLMTQMRAEQFELLKSIKEMQDEQEIQEMRLQQLQQRVRNAEELVDEKSSDCQMLREHLSELRKENSSLRNKVDDMQRLLRTAEEEREEAATRRAQTALSISASGRSHSFDSSGEDNRQPSPSKMFELSDEEGLQHSQATVKRRSVGRVGWRAMDPLELERERVLRLQLEAKLEALESKLISAVSVERVRFAEATKAHELERSLLVQELADAVDALEAKRRSSICEMAGFKGTESSDLPQELGRREVQMLHEELQGHRANLLLLEEENLRLRARLRARSAEEPPGSLAYSDRPRAASFSILSAVPSVAGPSPRGSPQEEVLHDVIQKLWSELETFRTERALNLEVRDQMIDRMRELLSRERLERHQFRLSVLFEQGGPQLGWEELKSDIETLEYQFFCAVCLAAKLQLDAVKGESSAVNVPQLWAEACGASLHWSQFRQWISDRICK